MGEPDGKIRRRPVVSQFEICDEIWSFCYKKQSNTEVADRRMGRGDVWTWTAIDADTELIITWMVGGRDAEIANIFMKDVADRLANRVQLTTDGHRAQRRCCASSRMYSAATNRNL
jgi:transposase-like protein